MEKAETASQRKGERSGDKMSPLETSGSRRQDAADGRRFKLPEPLPKNVFVISRKHKPMPNGGGKPIPDIMLTAITLQCGALVLTLFAVPLRR